MAEFSGIPQEANKPTQPAGVDQFGRGAVVRLKCGSQKMIVVDANADLKQKVVCNWMDKDFHCHQYAFPRESLVVAPAEDFEDEDEPDPGRELPPLSSRQQRLSGKDGSEAPSSQPPSQSVGNTQPSVPVAAGGGKR